MVQVRSRLKRLLSRSVLIALLASPLPVASAVIEVNETCTLVDAINAANNDDDSGGQCPPGGSGPDVLELSGDVTLTAVHDDFLGPTGLPTIASDITVDGAGFTIGRAEGAPPFRIFAVEVLGALTLNDVAIVGGQLEGTFDGSGVLCYLRSTLTLNNVIVRDNRGARSGGGVHGYGANVRVSNSTLSGNASHDRGGGMFVYGGLTVTDTTISGNHTGDYGTGGGLFAEGPTDIRRTTISGNSARSGGGVRFSPGYDEAAFLTNSTVSGNSALLFGGGILEDLGVDVFNTMVTGNYAGTAGGGIYSFGSLGLRNGIVANNVGGNCAGFVSSLGASFDDDGSCDDAAPITPGVDFDTTLADNGGPTATHALLAGGVAVDAAGECTLLNGVPIEVDQRGVPRPTTACDSGPFELVQGACCTDGPGSDSECILVDRGVCEAEGGRFLGVGSECRQDLDCVALLVSMLSMEAEVVPGGVRVRWTTALETDTVGFRVLRQSAGQREKTLQPVKQLVSASGSEVAGASYELLDDSPAAARAIQYFVEDIDLFGRATRHGPIVVERSTHQGRSIRVAPHR